MRAKHGKGDAMRCKILAMCVLAAEILCDALPRCENTSDAMPRCRPLRSRSDGQKATSNEDLQPRLDKGRKRGAQEGTVAHFLQQRGKQLKAAIESGASSSHTINASDLQQLAAKSMEESWGAGHERALAHVEKLRVNKRDLAEQDSGTRPDTELQKNIQKKKDAHAAASASQKVHILKY